MKNERCRISHFPDELTKINNNGPKALEDLYV